MKNARLLCTVLLISSGCVLASPSHRRAAVAGHWGSETVTEPVEKPKSVAVNDDVEIEENTIPVNNFVETESSNEENIEKPPLTAVNDVENETIENNESVEKVVKSEEVEQTETTTEEVEVSTPFPKVGEIQEIINGNTDILRNINLQGLDPKNVLIAREKDGDYHIHLRVPAEETLGEKTSDVDEDIFVTEANSENAVSTESVSDSTEAILSDNKAESTSSPVGNWGNSNENENSNVPNSETTGKPATSNGNAVGNPGLWSDTATTKSETSGSTAEESSNPETTKPETSKETSRPVMNWGKSKTTDESDSELVSSKDKSAPEEKTVQEKIETNEPEQAPVATSWFKHNDGTLNYLAILAVLFFLFI